MNKFYRALSLFVFLGLYTQVNAQNCPAAGGGGPIAQEEKLCADHNVLWKIEYYHLKHYNDNKIHIDWGDGTSDIYDLVQDGSDWKYNAPHTYPKGLTECTYIATAYVYVNGERCDNSEAIKAVTVWDTDNFRGNGLGLQTNVDEYQICAGNTATVTFTDITQLACLDPDHDDNVGRWIQWEYGTASTNPITGDVLIDGQIKTFPHKEVPVWLPPAQAVSGVETLNITVPNTSLTGEYFAVTLHNWNSCNPYPGNDPVSKTVYIRIVDAPRQILALIVIQHV